MNRSEWKAIEFEAEKLAQGAETPEERKAWGRVVAAIREARRIEQGPKAKNLVQRFAIFLGRSVGVF